MIEPKFIKQITTRYQTTVDNVVREYFQHLFLSFFYQEKNSERILFKGGTALRLIWKSPRFSEDLDFSGFNISLAHMESLIENVLAKIEKEGINTHIEEAKKTSGGYFAIFYCQSSSYKSDIQVEISLRAHAKSQGTPSLIQSDFLPAYNLMHLNEESLVSEKIQACLTRSKPRDFFDIYFLLRAQLLPSHMKKKLSLVFKQLETKEIDFSKELKSFLPESHHLIIKTFKETLKRELIRYGNL